MERTLVGFSVHFYLKCVYIAYFKDISPDFIPIEGKKPTSTRDQDNTLRLIYTAVWFLMTFQKFYS